MPSVKPRITTILTEETFQAVTELAELTKQTRSSLVADILTTFVPTMQKVLNLQRAASAAKEGLFAGIGGQVEKAEKLESEMLEMLSELENMMAGDASPAATNVGGVDASTPVPVTRGSKTIPRS